MTIYCIVCKKEPTPNDNSRSFHKFPDDKDLRERWMTAVGVQSVSKHTKICSDHFNENDFHKSDGYTRIRRLLTTAVPFKKVLCNITNTQDQAQFVQNAPIDACEFAQNAPKNTPIPAPTDKDSSTYIQDAPIHAVIDKGTNEMNNLSMVMDIGETAISDSTNTKLNKKNLKRSQPPIDVSDIPSTKKFRFLDGCQPTQLCRADFSSDEAWTRFLKFTIFKDRQVDAHRKKNQRKDCKIRNIKELLMTLREENCNSAADYLQVIF